MLKREISSKIEKHLKENKILLLLGPKGNQRTKLILNSIENQSAVFIYNLKDKKIKLEIEKFTSKNFPLFFEDKKYIVLQEMQVLSNLPELIEFVLFESKNLNLIGICSFLPYLDQDLLFALEQQNLILMSHSLSFQELVNNLGLSNVEKSIDDRLIYGNFETVIKNKEIAVDFLNSQIHSIINEQISVNDRINKKDNLLKMLQFISFSIGEHLSYNEIGEKCGLDNETVERYIDLLEKSFVLIKIPVFFNEHKYELKKAHCFYFYDNGIRNALINNFNPLDLRMDAKILWKNWLIVEKLKQENLALNSTNFYFWKTHTNQQIDLIIKNENNTFLAFQFQWNKKEKCKIPKSFSLYYPKIKTKIINKSTYWTFLIK